MSTQSNMVSKYVDTRPDILFIDLILIISKIYGP